MTHTFSDDEYSRYLDLKMEVEALQEFKESAITKALRYIKESDCNEVPCRAISNYWCSSCMIHRLFPGSDCPSGKEKIFGK